MDGRPSRPRLDKHVIGMLFFDDFSTKKRIGKKAKTGRGRGGDDGGGRVRGRKKGGEGEEIWGAKREAHAKSGLGTELDYYNGCGASNKRLGLDVSKESMNQIEPWRNGCNLSRQQIEKI